ncbi:MAG: endonuclease domain-containing protein, partial [Cellulomonadaceae bacterium]
QTAAAWHGLPVPAATTVHVWVPVDRRPVHNLVPHRFVLAAADVTSCGPLRFTTRTRSIVDALAHLPAPEADSLLAWASTRKLVSRSDLESALRTRPRTWGSTQLRRILAQTRTGALSAAERRLHALLDEAAITGWVANAEITDAGGRTAVIDVLFPGARVAIEVDGRAAHGHVAFQRDRTRQNRVALGEYLILRFTWDDLTRRPAMVIAQIRQALHLRQPR